MLLREDPGARLKKHAANFWGNKKSEIYIEVMEELRSTNRALGCNVSLKFHFLQSHLDFFSREIWDPCLTSTAKRFIRIYPAWKKVRAANGTQICWLITAERLHGRYQQKNTTDKRRQNEFLLHLFV